VQLLSHLALPGFYGLNMFSTLFFICLLVPVFRKLPAIYGITMLAFMILPLTTGKMDSITRYYLTLFPIYMLLAWWSSQGTPEQQLRRHGLIAVSFAILLSLGMVLFTLGVYSIA
jgi:peptidoglycan/LPS O-acetylase OafA/YrhL